jgi:sterol 14-demethylase
MCTEIADEPKIVARCKQLFEQIESGITPATVLFPWFPSPSMIMRVRATKQLYDIIVKAVKVRKQSGVPRDDALQIFLDSGDELTTIVGVCMLISKLPRYSRLCIIQFMMGLVTAGARATGTAGE